MTNIYYPADYLVEGGPPFDVNCPPVPKHHEDENLPIKLSCVLNYGKITYLIHAQGRVLAESEDGDAILAYYKEYLDGINAWAASL